MFENTKKVALLGRNEVVETIVGTIIEHIGVENGVVGTKIMTSAPIVWKILDFTHFDQFWHPWGQNLGQPIFEGD